MATLETKARQIVRQEQSRDTKAAQRARAAHVRETLGGNPGPVRKIVAELVSKVEEQARAEETQGRVRPPRAVRRAERRRSVQEVLCVRSGPPACHKLHFPARRQEAGAPDNNRITAFFSRGGRAWCRSLLGGCRGRITTVYFKTLRSPGNLGSHSIAHTCRSNYPQVTKGHRLRHPTGVYSEYEYKYMCYM